MAGMLFPDIGGALSAGSQAGAASAQNQYLMKDRAARDEIAPLIPKALQGDKEALNQIGTRHPDTAMKLAPLLDRLDANQRTKVKEDADYITRNGMAILSASPEQQPQLYARVRAEAAAQGRDVSTWPTQYDPGWVKFNVDKVRPVADYFSNQNEGVTLVPSGGGGGQSAPGGGGRAAGAIGGIESGGRYDAVGPVANNKGQRAYGKYQIMDFNVGPWTQEVLGQAMTPQQFLASPQAQDAVFQAKFSQYEKQYGSPEAASRAWFAGPGGMSNPGAKDVLGTTVQAYGDRFAQAYGAGATGPGPQIAQGDNTRADASGNPIQTSDGGSVQPDAMRMITPVLPPGTRLGKDKKTGRYIVQEGHFVVYDEVTKNPVGLIPVPTRTERQAPSGYQFSPGGGLAPIPGGPADPAIAKKAAPMTEGQANAALYADRMRAAEKVILANQAEGQSAVGKALEMVPGGNYLQGEGYQLYEQARRDFINAVLRRESGAVISDQEFANAEKQYFPRPGDKPDVLKQKAENRRIALEGISRAAGSSYKPTAEGTPPAASSPMPAPAPAPAPQQPAPQMPRAGADRGKVLFDARDAIAKGADPARVRERLKAMGIEDEP